MNDLLEIVLRRGLPEVMECTTEAWKNQGRHPKARNTRPDSGKGAKFTEEKRKQAIELRRAGKTYRELSLELGVCESHIRRTIGPIVGKRRPLLSDDQWREACRLREVERMSYQWIADFFNVSESCIRRRLER